MKTSVRITKITDEKKVAEIMVDGFKEHITDTESPFFISQGKFSMPFATNPILNYQIPDNSWSKNSLASIGLEVLRNGFKYCPLYNVISIKNITIDTIPDNSTINDDEEDEAIILIDKVSGFIFELAYITSKVAAVIAYYSNISNSGYYENTVLCFDRVKNYFYIDDLEEELIVYLDDSGKEVVRDEATHTKYRVDMHKNSIMVYGE